MPRKEKAHPWKPDPEVEKIGKGGPPPDNHPRRCQSRNRRGTQCGRWALTNRPYCEFHGGRNRLTHGMGKNYYSKYAGPLLAERLEELAQMDDDTRLNLADEVDAARIQCTNAVKLYSAAMFNEVKVSPETQATAAVVLKDALKCVSDLVTQMAKVEALKKDKISVHNIKWITDRILRILDHEIKDEDLCRKIVKKIIEIRLADESPSVVIGID